MLGVWKLTLSRLSPSSDCGMLAEARRLCDEDGGGGLRPRDVDMVVERILNSFSRVGGIADKKKAAGRVVQGSCTGCFFESDTATKAEAVRSVTMMVKPEAPRNTKLHSLSGVATTQINPLNSAYRSPQLVNSPGPCHNTHTNHNGYRNRPLRRQQGPRPGQHPLPTHVHSTQPGTQMKTLADTASAASKTPSPST